MDLWFGKTYIVNCQRKLREIFRFMFGTWLFNITLIRLYVIIYRPKWYRRIKLSMKNGEKKKNADWAKFNCFSFHHYRSRWLKILDIETYSNKSVYIIICINNNLRLLGPKWLTVKFSTNKNIVLTCIIIMFRCLWLCIFFDFFFFELSSYCMQNYIKICIKTSMQTQFIHFILHIFRFFFFYKYCTFGYLS